MQDVTFLSNICYSKSNHYKELTIIEGSYSHHPYFGEVYDLRVYLTVDPEVRAERIRQRPEHLHQRFFEVWIPMEQRYFAGFEIEKKADLVLDTRNLR